ncbi:hypothetical protein AXFE_35220 [Acidithrix ferrooxidans]|uniref:Uncharacterized protein n=1 Tax=Acidithrix ferrooxidans TaxID=1280514 RepID=A0A0D8HCF5_9ACTN|nr:hypothetical protein AXFE_35220 [Acidithrix ferrooxidans]
MVDRGGSNYFVRESIPCEGDYFECSFDLRSDEDLGIVVQVRYYDTSGRTNHLGFGIYT